MRRSGSETSPATRRLRALRAFVAQDGRPGVASPPDHAPKLCAFVTRARERIAALELRRPALVIVVEGAKELHEAGFVRRVAAGSAVFLPAGWRGDVVNDPAGGCAYRALFLDFPASLPDRVAAAHPDAARESAADARGSAPPAPLDGALLDAAIHLAEAFAIPRPPASILEHRAMEVVLAGLIRGVFPRPERAVAARVAALLRSRPDHSWTAAEAGRALGWSPATLRRRLSAEGASFRAILVGERMRHGRRLIEAAGCSVAQAAQASGYASPSRFARRFRAEHGVAPSRIGQADERIGLDTERCERDRDAGSS